MYEIGIWTENNGWQSWRVDGCEAAYEAYRKACDFCEAVGADNAALWDAETSEVLESWAGDGEE